MFLAGVVVGGGIQVEADAADDRATRGLSRWDGPEDASSGVTGSLAASMGTEASCGGGSIEEVEAEAAVD